MPVKENIEKRKNITMKNVVYITGISLLTILAIACGPMLITNWLSTGGTDTIKCTVEKGKTTKAQFDRDCGRAQMKQESRGCRAYGRDDMEVLYYCFKDGKLSDVLTTQEWLAKRGE